MKHIHYDAHFKPFLWLCSPLHCSTKRPINPQLLRLEKDTRIMEDQCSPLSLSWGCYFQDEGLEGLKQSLLYTTLDLETTIVSAQEEIARKEDELLLLKDLLMGTVTERDELQAICRRLAMEKVVLQQQLEATAAGEDLRRGESNNGSSSSDSNENVDPPPPSPSPSPSPLPMQLGEVIERLAAKKALPENGKFLQAVIESGPLLQTLMLAGPLPQWQRPPPPVNCMEIPPVTICSPKLPQQQDSCVSSDNCLFQSKERSCSVMSNGNGNW